MSRFFELSDGKLSVSGVTLLSDVPDNVSLTGFSSICQTSDAPLPLFEKVQSISSRGGFLGYTKDEPSALSKNSLGKFNGRKFVSIFRFKTWWSTMWVGNSGSDLQVETQWVLIEVPEIQSYVLILPSIEGKFRSALHPGADGHVMLWAESGSTKERTSSFDQIAYVHVSDNPYSLMQEAYSALRVHLNTFRLLGEKSLPSAVDKFGWCTWDAFYVTVDTTGIWHGVKDFVEGGITPRFLIIDDGWQSINFDDENPLEDSKNLLFGGTQMMARLYRFMENEKFRRYKGGSLLSPNAPSFNPKRTKILISKFTELEQVEKARDKAIQSGVTEVSDFESKIEDLKQQCNDIMYGEQDSGGNEGSKSCSCSKSENVGFKAFTSDLRTRYKGLDDIYVWHALCGAWGGVRPGATHLDAKIEPVFPSPGLKGTMNDLAVVKIVKGSIGLVNPAQATEFYDSMHSYLAKVGITGVKVDVIQSLEYVCEEYGGRVELQKAYYKGLSDSLVKNFNGTGLIASMQQCNDFFFLGTWQISLGRVGDDFWFQDPNGDPMGVYWLQGVHMIHCAYNSMWMGQTTQPDWDMFQSDHQCAKFHAGSRAICGGPVYVSDSIAGHDFDLIKNLVFPDGTIPRCQHFALPTRDCLFQNPLFDGETILKIWNLNKFGGVIGLFNCQGAGWDPKEQKIRSYPQFYKPMSGSAHVTDVEWDQKKEAAKMGEAEEYAVYLNQAEQLLLMTPKSDPIHLTIQPSSFEIFSFVPIKKLGSDTKFAPVGLTNMFNSEGTIQELYYSEGGDEINVKIKIKGGGKFLAYSSGKPEKSYLNGVEVGFEWSGDGKLTLDVPWIEDIGISDLGFAF
eukprot:TRINITY_DN579_c0_g1_i1.p1 TRINITY_DN579_c0_g1~~TRINITY_DN579_c0_g1_i1.p1  ORF type:complete len:847 (+),score=139.58 TRINITY_DN579_c0_g1_i1:541-3081(+)